MKYIVLIIIMIAGISCAKLGESDDNPKDEYCNAIYQEENDQAGRTWFQFSAGGFKCFALVGSVWVRCMRDRHR